MTKHPDWNCYPANAPMLGMIPLFLDLDDPRPAREQFDENYAHGGGWQPFKGFALVNIDGKGHQIPIPNWRLIYPDDPAYQPIGWCYLRDECIIVWPYSWVMIWKADGTTTGGDWEICRMD